MNDFRFEPFGDLDSGLAPVRARPDWQVNAFSFTCLEFVESYGRIFCGTTNFSNNLLQTFDPTTKQFESMRYGEFSDDPYEIKIHRSLAFGGDGWLYGATSGLHQVDERLRAPGGRLFRFDYRSRRYETIAIPCAHDYIQTISLDPVRELIYGFTYPVFNFFVYSLRAAEVVYCQYMASIPHLSTIDDDGRYWGTWSHQHRFFRYDPSDSSVQFFDRGFPEPGRSLMYHDAGPIDMALNIGDGSLYLGEESGGLYRLAPETAEVEFLGKPFSSPRLPGICRGPGKTLFLAGGSDWNCHVGSYDLESGTFRDLGKIEETASGEPCFRVHDLVYVDGKLYVGETDHPSRSSWLWEISLAS